MKYFREHPKYYLFLYLIVKPKLKFNFSRRGSAYCCYGDLTEWTKCTYKTQEPKRLNQFIINDDLKDYTCLKDFQFEANQVRVFEKSLEEESVLVKKEQGATIDEKKPLKGMNFSTVGKLNKKNAEIKLILDRLGGKLVSNLDDTIVALITNSEQLQKMGKKLSQSLNLNIHAIDEKFIEELCNQPAEKLGDIEQLILSHNLASWGSDLKTRIQYCQGINQLHDKLRKTSNENKYMSKSNGTVKLKVKGGAVVDPDSGLEDDGHILLEPKSNDPYSCVLGYVDIQRGTNSYYKLQLIENDKKIKYNHVLFPFIN